MKAAWIEQYGGVEKIKVGLITKPKRQPGEVLVKMMSSTLNHHDVYLRRGEAGKFLLPVIMGSDGAGEVIESDAISNFTPGDRVAIYPVLSCGDCYSCRLNAPHKCNHFGMIGGDRNGTHAKYVSVPEACLVLLPSDLSFDTAATISLAGLTAWNMVVDEGRALEGEHALVLGASGGVGVFTILLLKRLGVHVHAVTSSPNKKDALLALGVDTVLEDAPVSVLNYTKKLRNEGVDLAFNCVGGQTWRYVPLAVRSGGRILVCGSVRSPVLETDIRQIFYRNLKIFGCSMGTPAALSELLTVAAKDHNLNVKIDQTISLNDIPEAHRRMEMGEITGKILVKNDLCL